MTGTSKLADLPGGDMVGLIQVYLRCGCRLGHSAVYEHVRVKIGGKCFNAGEKLRVGVRCGSVVTSHDCGW